MNIHVLAVLLKVYSGRPRLHNKLQKFGKMLQIVTPTSKGSVIILDQCAVVRLSNSVGVNESQRGNVSAEKDMRLPSSVLFFPSSES